MLPKETFLTPNTLPVGVPLGLPISPLPSLFPWFLYPLSSAALFPPGPAPPPYNDFGFFTGTVCATVLLLFTLLVTGETTFASLLFFTDLFTVATSGLLFSSACISFAALAATVLAGVELSATSRPGSPLTNG